MNTEKDNDTSKASLEAPRDVEMTTNDITTTDAAASEPQPSTTSTTNEALATTAKPTTAIATPTKEVSKMSQAVAKAGTKLARSGCNCQGSCLVHSCFCFVEGQFCDPSVCKCCSQAKSDGTADSAHTSSSAPTVCQNNDKEENLELRRDRLMAAMQDHPEAFWREQSAPHPANVTPAEPKHQDTEPGLQKLDPKIMASIQDLVNERLLDSSDGMEIDVPSSDADSSIHGNLSRLQHSLEKLSKDVKAHDNYATSQDLAITLVQSTSKDVLKILEFIQSVEDSKNDTVPSSTAAAVENKVEDATDDASSAELHLLQCSEEFPEDDGATSDGSSYYKNLDKKTTMYTTAGNSNDPLVKSLICKETGFFDGDDSSVYEKDKLKDSHGTAGLETAQQLALIQETTRMVRAKTLELTKRRLKRQRVE